MRFLLLAFLLVGSLAQAADRQLVDLMYLPNAGTLYGETAFNFEGSEYNINKAETQVTTHNTILSQELGFGLTDALYLGVQYEHQLAGEDKIKGGDSVDTLGSLNPSLKATFRVMDQAAATYNLDIRAAYLPDLFDRETSDNDTEYTAAYGGAAYKVGARLGQKNGTSHWNFEVNLTLLGEAEAKLEDEKLTKDASFDIEVAYAFQENMLPWLDFRAHAGITRVGGYDVESDDSATDDSEYDPNWVADVGVKFLVSPINDTLVVYAAMGGFWSKGYDIETAGDKDEVRDFKGWKGSVGALYQF